MWNKIKKYVLSMLVVYITLYIIIELLNLSFKTRTTLISLSNIFYMSQAIRGVQFFLIHNPPEDKLSNKKWYLFGWLNFILIFDQLLVLIILTFGPLTILIFLNHILIFCVFLGMIYATYFFVSSLSIYNAFNIILRDVIMMGIPFLLLTYNHTKPFLSSDLLLNPFSTQLSIYTVHGQINELINILFGFLVLTLFMTSFYIVPCQRSNRLLLYGFFSINALWFIASQNAMLTHIQFFPITHHFTMFLFIITSTTSMAFNLEDFRCKVNDMNNTYTYLNTFWTTIIIGIFPIAYIILCLIVHQLYGVKISLYMFPIMSVVCLILIIIRDIYIRKENQKLLYTIDRSSKLDPLTNIYNRRALFEEINQFSHHYCLFFFDIKHFKNINDSFGHDVGDHILLDIASLFKHLSLKLDEQTLFCRFGGDEFLFILDSHDIKTINLICQTLSETHQIYDELTDITYCYSLNIGYTLSNEHETLDDFIKQADIAMYKNKHSNLLTPVMFNDDLRTEYMQQMMIKNDLPKFIAAKQIHAVFQPKVDLHTNEIIGFETLARWNHPLLGMISPLTFVHFAEELGESYNLDILIFEEACKFQSELLTLHFTQQTAINVSLNTLGHPNFISEIKRLLTNYSLTPQMITLEILENVYLTDKLLMIDTMKKLRELGFKMSIDDFGTAYSSLNRLYEIPVDELKIPREFVLTNENERQQAIIKAIKDMAQNLNIHTVVEGIETRKQLDLFASLGFDCVQGYYFSKPLSKEEYIDYIKGSSLTSNART